MTPRLKRFRNRIIVAIALFVVFYTADLLGLYGAWFGEPEAVYIEFVLFLIPFVIAGYDVVAKAAINLSHGHGLDENFLMTIATIGAFCLVFFPDTQPHMAEGAAVMLFYQVGELFQKYAVGKSRKSISEMMDIAPEFANVMRDGNLEQVDPFEVLPGDEIIVKPGERIPLDGIVISGHSQIDTAALTGEAVPRTAQAEDEVLSGCVNLNGTLTINVTKPYEDSTVSRILELVENAADKKARTENFITRFARYYTPIVVLLAVLLSVVPPLFVGEWSSWIFRGLTFLVVSCPCALVISVPLSFFGGIGGASKLGILVKGSNYLEMLSKVDTVVFDKTGTLTSGTFEVTEVIPADGVLQDVVLKTAALAESYSTHPIAKSVVKAFHGEVDLAQAEDVEEIGGHGVKASIDGKMVLVGNDKLMNMHDIAFEAHNFAGTQIHVAIEGKYCGTIMIGDTIKEDAADAILALHKEGVRDAVMLTGDSESVASLVAKKLGLDAFFAQLLPQNKVEKLEEIISQRKKGEGAVAFVGDGINDAPALMRADVGIAMGAMGSDAAIEAADIVLMDDKPTRIAQALKLARRTLRIVWQNIIFALGIKFAVLILAALGIANMWMAVFADVGVAFIAILNAMRAMNVSKTQIR